MKRIILLGLLAVIVLLFFQFDLEQYLTLDYVKSQQEIIDQYYRENRALTLIGFFLGYVVITGGDFRPGYRVDPGVFCQHHWRLDRFSGIALPVSRHGGIPLRRLAEID
jgi:hypothetical protein